MKVLENLKRKHVVFLPLIIYKQEVILLSLELHVYLELHSQSLLVLLMFFYGFTTPNDLCLLHLLFITKESHI